jgi:hypothetical protein
MPFAMPFMLISDGLLKWMIFVATTEHALPYSSTVVSAFPAWLAILIYIPLTAACYLMYICEAKTLNHVPIEIFEKRVNIFCFALSTVV